jgi:hypothetical protein
MFIVSQKNTHLQAPQNPHSIVASLQFTYTHTCAHERERERENANKILIRKPNRKKNHSEDLYVDGSLIL